MWPALSVRSWQGVLDRREPHYYELYGYGPDLDDDVIGADYTRRIHELRGLVMAQVAEIEDLLWHLRERWEKSTNPSASDVPRLTAGQLLTWTADLLRRLGKDRHLSSQIESIRSTIAKRNRLVHAVIRVGCSQLNDNAPRDPVIVLLFHVGTPPYHEKDSLDEDIGDAELMAILTEAYSALESAVDIWLTVTRAIPSE